MIRLRKLARAASLLTTPLAPEDILSLFNPVFSARQLRGVVTRVVPETADSATIFFHPGRGWQAHLAGQWARIGVELDGVRHWRSYSLSAPAGQDPAITVTDMGAVSGALVRGTKPGDILFLAPPQGDFVLPEHPRPLLMLTAGSGITPVMSMIRTLVPHRPDSDVVLIHTARTAADAIFREELAELADQFPNFRVTHWFTGDRGRLDFTSAADLDRLCPDWRQRAAYACGPEDFLNDTEALWEAEAEDAAPAAAVRPGTLTIERFTTSPRRRCRARRRPGHLRGLRPRGRGRRRHPAARCRRGRRSPDAQRLPHGHLPQLPHPAAGRPRPRSSHRRSARRAGPTNPDVRVGSRRPR